MKCWQGRPEVLRSGWVLDMLRVKPAGFVDGLVVKCGGRKESRITPKFGAGRTNWLNRVFMN